MRYMAFERCLEQQGHPSARITILPVQLLEGPEAVPGN
jgi:hypothetical protein